MECGIDLIEIARIGKVVERFGSSFEQRVWTEGELAYCRGRLPELAARFAAKEAAAKALGTGIAGRGGIAWRQIEVLSDAAGKPYLSLHGAASQRAEALGLKHWRVSLTHTRELACAFVVATGDPAQDDPSQGELRL